ncbi:LysR family transcriptional regulator [Enterococcus sp. AZ103]|uniref:LysR family transcriptional regulator n=1 Tax=Enterococcus sp. AZ103 TaxID=2774628 RepID=UPI003F295189
MDTGNWRIIRKVIEKGNLTDASIDLNISASGISYTIKKIEAEIGFPLFIRHRSGMSLTTNGKELLPQIDSLLQAEEQFDDTLLKINKIANGNLIIGTYKSISINWLPKILNNFFEEYPKVNVNIKQGSSERIEKSLKANSIDFAFTSYRNRSDFEWIDLVQDPLLVVLPLNHPYKDMKAIPLKVLKENKFIGSSVNYEYDINRILRENNVSNQHVNVSTNDEETILEMVKQNLGLGLLFKSYIDHKHVTDLLVKPTEPLIHRRLGIAVRKSQLELPIIQNFIQSSKKVII